jgi:hypothetical protein
MTRIKTAFKFAEYQYSQALLTRGNVHIGGMNGFADPTKHPNEIYDPHEGIFTLTNTYDNYEVKEELEGLLRIMKEKPAIGQVLNASITREFNLNPANIFCMTTDFFSDTLLFAIRTNRDSCVFITDVVAFTEVQRDNIHDAKILCLKHCLYWGREIRENNPFERSFTDHFLSKQYPGYLLKPQDYSAQNEIRSVWKRHDKTSDAINIDIPSLMPFCIEVKFGQLFNAVKENNKLDKMRINLLVHLKDDSRPIGYEQLDDNSVWTPAIYEEDGDRVLYLQMARPPIIQTSNGPVISGLTIGNMRLNGVSLEMGPYGIRLAVQGSAHQVRANEIDYIEYSIG